MVAGIYNFTVARGVSFGLPITLTDPSGSSYDLTGYTIKAQIREDYGSPVLMAFSVTGPLDTTGKFILALTPAQTAALPLRPCVWDCLLEVSAEVNQILRGTIGVLPLVTQP